MVTLTGYVLGKGEAESSILSCSTIHSPGSQDLFPRGPQRLPTLSFQKNVACPGLRKLERRILMILCRSYRYG